jgi:hypothetical protein
VNGRSHLSNFGHSNKLSMYALLICYHSQIPRQCHIFSRSICISKMSYLHSRNKLKHLNQFTSLYTLSDKNPSVWNFLSPEPEVTCGTVVIIIRVPTLALLLCKTTLLTCSTSGASLPARSLTHLAYTINASLFILTLHTYDKQQQPSSLLPFRLTHMYSCILQLIDSKNALHVFLSLCSKTVSNYRVIK